MGKSARLFVSFFKISSFTFGGGYAMIPLIEQEVIHKQQWVEKKDFLELLTLAQSAPGPIALNASVFVGYRIDGFRGALAAVGGVVLPCFVIILTIAIFFSHVRDNPTIEAVFKGMRPAVVALIITPLFSLSRGLGWKRGLAAIVATAAAWYFGFTPIYLIVAGALAGLLYGYFKKR